MKKVYPLSAVLVVLAIAFVYVLHTTTKVTVTPQVAGVHTTAQKKSTDVAPTIGQFPPVSNTDTSSDTASNNPSSTMNPAPAGSTGPVSNVLAVISSTTAPTNTGTTMTTPTTPTTPTPPVLVPPTVSITSPANNATVSGIQTVTVNATDNKSVSLVTFVIDGQTGATSPNAPFSFSWDTTKLTNGTHTIAAIATDSDNLSATSATVTVTVNNTVSVPVTTNLITNPSFETSTNGTTPDGWQTYADPSATTSFSYLNSGHTGTKSVEVQTTAVTTGGSDWFYADVPVTAGQSYKFSNWYESNVDTEVDAEVVMSDGSTQYFWLGAVFASPTWNQFTTTFTPPAGAKSIAIYQVLAKVGYVISDDYSLSAYTPTPYAQGIVSVTLDDGWANQYANAYPVLKQLGIPATFYIISGSLTDQPDYMSGAQVQDLYANGNEIGDHTITHPDLTTVSAAQLQSEMADSQTTLQNLIGAPVTDFAYPYGAYNTATLAMGQQYFDSQRTVNSGFNTKDNLDPTQLKMYEVDSNVTQAQVQGWIDAAVAQHSWLILTYHEVNPTPVDPTDTLYTTQPSDFSAEMNYLKNSGALLETVHQALATVEAQ